MAAEGNQMIHKQMNNAVQALAGLQTGHTVMVGGFGSAGLPSALINAILETDAWNLTIVSNNAGYDREGVAILIEEGRVKKLICSYPLTAGATAFRRAYAEGKVELELVPQGTLVERIRCAGAGLGGFLSPISVGTSLAEGNPSKAGTAASTCSNSRCMLTSRLFARVSQTVSAIWPIT